MQYCIRIPHLQFIEDNLGPTLEAAGYGDLKLMICDDQRPLVPHWARGVLASPTADSYVDGFAVHWYTDDILGIPDAPGLEVHVVFDALLCTLNQYFKVVELQSSSKW